MELLSKEFSLIVGPGKDTGAEGVYQMGGSLPSLSKDTGEQAVTERSTEISFFD